MIDMQMRADDGVDVLAREAGLGDVLQELRLQGCQRVQRRGLSLPMQVSTTSFRPGASTSSAWMESSIAPSGVHEVRIEPRHLLQRLGCRLLQEDVFVGNRQLDLDNPRDLHVADLPLQHDRLRVHDASMAVLEAKDEGVSRAGRSAMVR